jgi:integrase
MKTLHAKIATDNGPYAANRAMQLCRAVCRLAVEENLLASDPTKSVTMKPEEKRSRFLQPEELVRLEATLKAETDRSAVDFVRLALLTGVRKGNLLAARWDEISFALSKWNIPETKNGEAQTIELTPSAVTVLKARERGDSPWVFPNPQSESGHAPDFKREWQRIRAAAGIPDCRIHDLRRTTASYEALSGQSLLIVGASLGHRSSQSTQVYARLHQDAVRRSLLAGEAEQKRMMAEAAKTLKAEARKKARKLTVVSRATA